MFLQNLIRMSVRHGWAVVITADIDNNLELDFHRRTLSGKPFCFSVRTTNGDINRIKTELFSFIESFDPERYAYEWYDKSGENRHGLYKTIKQDLEDIRNEAWLLILDISSSGIHTPFEPDGFGGLCLS